MRPEIPDEMTKRIEALDDYHGYATVGEFVRDTARRRLEKLEAKVSVVESADEHNLNIGIDDLEIEQEDSAE